MLCFFVGKIQDMPHLHDFNGSDRSSKNFDICNWTLSKNNWVALP